LIRCRLRRGA